MPGASPNPPPAVNPRPSGSNVAECCERPAIMLPVGANVPPVCAVAIVALPTNAASKTTRALLPPVPLIELVTWWDLAGDIDDDGVPLPALHELLLTKIPEQ